MRRYIMFLFLVVFLSGCAGYSSANLIRATAAEGETLKVGYGLTGIKVEGVGEIIIYRATNPGKSFDKIEECFNAVEETEETTEPDS